MNLHNPPAQAIRPPRGRTLTHARAGQDGTRAVRARMARLLTLRHPAGRRRVAGVALAAAGCAATWAAVIVGRQPSLGLSHGATVQVLFAATMIVCALGETLHRPAAVPAITGDRPRSGLAGRRKGLGTCAVVAGCLLGPSVGGAALGADWATSLLTALAVACSVAAIAAQHSTAGYARSGAC